jgi:hypothetical protein
MNESYLLDAKSERINTVLEDNRSFFTADFSHSNAAAAAAAAARFIRLIRFIHSFIIHSSEFLKSTSKLTVLRVSTLHFSTLYLTATAADDFLKKVIIFAFAFSVQDASSTVPLFY